MLKRSNKGLQRGKTVLKCNGKGLSKGQGLKRSGIDPTASIGDCKGKGMKAGGPIKKRSVSEEKKQQLREQREKDSVFYQEIRIARGPYSEVSGTHIGSGHSSANYHHIIGKACWPAGRYIHENVIILTIDEHANVENDPTMYEEVNRRREAAKKKYMGI